MMTHFLRNAERFPEACVAFEERHGNIVFAVAAWNSKKDAKVFERAKAREIAELRVKQGRLRQDGERFVLRAAAKKGQKLGALVGMQIKDPGKGTRLEAVLEAVIKDSRFPQRARDGAKLSLKHLREAREKQARAHEDMQVRVVHDPEDEDDPAGCGVQG